MEPLNIDPKKCYSVEVYETAANGKPRCFGVKDLTYEQAKEYFDRMTPDTKFQFFRVWPDGSHQKFNFGPMEEVKTQFGIWERGFIDVKGEYQPSALIKICDTETEANEALKDYDRNHFIEPF